MGIARTPHHSDLSVKMILFRYFIVISALIFCAGCSCGTSTNEDAGTPDGQDGSDGDVTHDADEGEVYREVVLGTLGFCLTTGHVSKSCQDDTDCIGFRKPIGVYCPNNQFIVTDVGCDFAEKAEFPENDECSADEYCRKAPRRCHNGVCSYYPPDRTCNQNSDCKFVEYGCACIAMSVSEDGYQPSFGVDCTGLTACFASHEVQCIDNLCLLSGEYMDDGIKALCEESIPCGTSQETVADCITIMTENNYRMAAQYWPIIESTSIVEECKGFFNGPWKEALECTR